jgi:hypothetical protein
MEDFVLLNMTLGEILLMGLLIIHATLFWVGVWAFPKIEHRLDLRSLNGGLGWIFGFVLMPYFVPIMALRTWSENRARKKRRAEKKKGR